MVAPYIPQPVHMAQSNEERLRKQRERNRKNYKLNRERILAEQRAKYAEDKSYRERRLSKQREKYAENPEILKSQVMASRHRNKSAYNAYQSRRRALVNSAATDDATELKMIQKFYAECPAGYHVDHIVPLAKGGRHEMNNLQHLEASLNHQKSDKCPDDWNDPRPFQCRR